MTLVAVDRWVLGYRPPTVLVRGSQIHSPNGIQADPDGNPGWASSEGALVTVFKNKGAFRERVVKRAVKGRPHVYYVASWSDDVLMNYIRAYPTYLFLDSDHNLVAFQVGNRKRIGAGGVEGSQ